MPSRLRLLLLAALLGLIGPGARAADAPLSVVASFSILGDLVQQVGGDRVQVSLLVGPDSDAHAVQPYYTLLLARETGMTITIKATAEDIEITAA